MIRNHLTKGGIALLTVGLLFAAACNNDNDNTPPALTPHEQMLTAQAWNLQSATVTDSTGQDSSLFMDCMADDKAAFNSSHEFTFSDDSTHCDSATVLQYGDGIWAFTTAEDTLMLKPGDGDTYLWSVDNLTDSTLQISYADSVYLTDSTREVVTKKLTFKPIIADTTNPTP